jgi:hypothetical protein
LPPTPEGVAFLTDRDRTDTRPLDEGGTGLVCTEITGVKSLRDAWQAWKWMTKLVP